MFNSNNRYDLMSPIYYTVSIDICSEKGNILLTSLTLDVANKDLAGEPLGSEKKKCRSERRAIAARCAFRNGNLSF